MAYDAILNALSDPTRRRIVEALCVRPMNVTSLAAGLPVSRPAVSQHLKVLSDSGLLRVRPRGTSRLYSLDPDGLAELRAYLDGLWEEALGAFAQHVKEETQND